jgi:hypothetical protein
LQYSQPLELSSSLGHLSFSQHFINQPIQHPTANFRGIDHMSIMLYLNRIIIAAALLPIVALAAPLPVPPLLTPLLLDDIENTLIRF